MTTKQLGMKFAADKHVLVLLRARNIARVFSQLYTHVTIDDVQAMLKPDEKLGNAAGSVFIGPEWECVGFRPSTRLGNHGRIVRVWRLK